MTLTLIAVWFLIGETHRGSRGHRPPTLLQVRYGLSLLLLEVLYTPGVDSICRQVSGNYCAASWRGSTIIAPVKCIPPRKLRRKIQRYNSASVLAQKQCDTCSTSGREIGFASLA